MLKVLALKLVYFMFKKSKQCACVCVFVCVHARVCIEQI